VPLAMLTRLALPIAMHDRQGVDHDCAGHAHEHGDPAHGDLFDTWSCRPGTVFDAAALRDWLKSPPTGLLRLKGFVRTDETSWSELQFAGRHGSLRASFAPAEGAALVAIGLRGQLPRQALDAVFQNKAFSSRS